MPREGDGDGSPRINGVSRNMYLNLNINLNKFAHAWHKGISVTIARFSGIFIIDSKWHQNKK